MQSKQPNTSQTATYQYPGRDSERGVVWDARTRKKAEREWTSIEEYLFQEVALPYIRERGGSVVDIGAGEGRYSELVAPYVKMLTVVEPDKARAERARERLASYEAEVAIHNSFLSQVPLTVESIDSIVCMQLLQHISVAEVDELLDSSSTALRQNGVFVLAFTKKTRFDHEFNATWRENERAYYYPISEELFHIAAREHPEETLLVHKMDLDGICKALEERGFSIEAVEPYAPRLSERLHHQLIGLLLAPLPLLMRHRILRALPFVPFIDVYVVARKVAAGKQGEQTQ
jgi:2-polyprenyl-3-methyl-5-hydroxy-6-metoxy-1,4-benzoquinol methylase